MGLNGRFKLFQISISKVIHNLFMLAMNGPVVVMENSIQTGFAAKKEVNLPVRLIADAFQCQHQLFIS